MNVRGLAQHYYHRTSLLDFTSSADVAKFFATTDYDRESDAYYPVAHPDKLGVIYCYELRLPTAFQLQSDGTQLSVIGKQVFMRSGAQHGFLLDMPKDLDMKKMPIVRAVYFRHNKIISDRIFRESDQGKKYFAEDLIEKAWKQEYKQKMEKSIVSADAVRLNVKFNQGETFDTICRKLSKYDIKVDSSYSPHFSDDLLAEYYNDINNGWWDEFCHDVYFSGADGCIYKNALINVQQDPRYRKVFVR